jgi:Tfp pilus assembly protein PilN
LGDEVPPVKAVRLLGRISRAVPQDIELQTNLFTLDGDQVRLSGEAADFKSVDRLKGRLEEVSLFSGVEILGANVNQSGEGVRFSLRLTVKSDSQGA